ncbi:hypothetical protein L1887_01736 [Cichorium endivia]|nr:hypothetical protein L1887_01736 [Cichorium endivia]
MKSTEGYGMQGLGLDSRMVIGRLLGVFLYDTSKEGLLAGNGSGNEDGTERGDPLQQGWEKKHTNAETRFIYEPQDTVEQVTTHFDFDSAGGEDPLDMGFVDTHEEEKDQSLDEVYSSITDGHEQNKVRHSAGVG